jgi:hypothetical protein
MELASVIIAALAFGLSLVGFLDSRHKARAAEADARDAVRAAEESAAAATRSAEAAERQLALSIPPAIDFFLEVIDKIRYALVNSGTSTATGVTIEAGAFALGRDLPVDVTLKPRQTHEFRVFRSAQTSVPSSIVVTCNEAPEGVRVLVPNWG